MTEEQKLRRSLGDLIASVRGFCFRLDQAMRELSSLERGQRIATLLNELSQVNDRALYFGLGFPFREDAGRGRTDHIVKFARRKRARP